MRVVFAGTPPFAVATLDALARNHAVEMVWTRPDRGAGRGQVERPSAVKARAQVLGLPVATPMNRAALAALLTTPPPDVLIVVAFGMILPSSVLHWPRLGAINVHASLLPRWRGAAPIARAIEAGDPETGISIMRMTEGLDEGPVLARVATPISPEDTAGTLHDRLAPIGPEALLSTLSALARGPVPEEAQTHTDATYAHKLSRAEAVIDWGRDALTLVRTIRAFTPAPGASTVLAGKRLRVIAVGWAEVGAIDAPPGTVVAVEKDALIVATRDLPLAITQVQLEGGKALDVRAFLQGHRVAPGERLGIP